MQTQVFPHGGVSLFWNGNIIFNHTHDVIIDIRMFIAAPFTANYLCIFSGEWSIYRLYTALVSAGNGGQSSQSRKSWGGQTEGQVSKPGSQAWRLRLAEEKTSEGGAFHT